MLGPNPRPVAVTPGQRAEGGLGMIPAGVLRPPQMLDSTPLARPGSPSSTTRSSMFREHLSEMEDTVGDSITDMAKDPLLTLQSSRMSHTQIDSPVLGHTEDLRASKERERTRQHILAWNTADHQDDYEMSANLTTRAPSSAIGPSDGERSPPSREHHSVVSPVSADGERKR